MHLLQVDSSARVEVYPLHIPDERRSQRTVPQVRQGPQQQQQQQQPIQQAPRQQQRPQPQYQPQQEAQQFPQQQVHFHRSSQF